MNRQRDFLIGQISQQGSELRDLRTLVIDIQSRRNSRAQSPTSDRPPSPGLSEDAAGAAAGNADRTPEDSEEGDNQVDPVQARAEHHQTVRKRLDDYHFSKR